MHLDVRIAAAIVAFSAWLGLILQLVDSLQITGNRLLASLWGMAMYFTILTNLLVAVLFTMLATGHTVATWLIGGALLSIVLVGVIYALLLSDTPIGTVRTSALSNSLVHRVTPLLVVFFWLGYASRGTLQWTDALYWAAYPIAYLGYVLIRGQFTGQYPYPFIHVPEIGWIFTLRNAAAIAACFIAASLILIGIDRLSRPI